MENKREIANAKTNNWISGEFSDNEVRKVVCLAKKTKITCDF